MRIYISIILLFNLFLTSSIEAQDQSLDTEDAKEAKKGTGVGSIFYGQPGKAALYSLMVPGGGQYYNRRYWKIPIVWGIEGFAIYNLVDKINASRDATSCWKGTLGVDDGDITICPDSVTSSSSLQNTAFEERQSARTGKDVAWILMGTAHLFNIVEAFVDRHLINFDTTEDLSFHNRPNPNIAGKSILISDITLLRVTISLNR